MIATLFSTILPIAASAVPGDEDWPGFRGARARGVAEGWETPSEWDVTAGENVLWRTPVPGLAHSSPAVWGERVFLTTAVRVGAEAELSSLYGSPNYGAGGSVEDEGAHRFLVLALERESGRVLWERVAHEGVPAVKRHPKSTHANPTPACDAERVVAFFGSEGLFAFDHDGAPLWSVSFGVLDSGAPDVEQTEQYQWGFASSPVLFEGRVYVQCDIQEGSFVACLDASSGEELWRTPRAEKPTWSTPTVHDVAAGDRRQLVLNGYHHIGGYDLATGKEIWKLVGGGDVPVPTPVAAHGLILLTSAHGRDRPIYAVDERAEGLLTKDPEESAGMVWHRAREGVYMQTLLPYGEELYACSDGGVLACYDVGTGERYYRERLGSGLSGFSGSPVAADGKLYFTAEDGTVHVIAAGPDFERIGTGKLGETCLSTPAISRGVLFFRTRHHLVAVGF